MITKANTQTVFSIAELAAALGGRLEEPKSDMHNPDRVTILGPGWQLFAEIPWRKTDRIALSVHGRHTHYHRFVYPEGDNLECSVGRARDVAAAAKEAWRKLGDTAMAYEANFAAEQAREMAHVDLMEKVYELLREAMPEATQPKPSRQHPTLYWTGYKQEASFELRFPHPNLRTLAVFDYRPDFDYLAGGKLMMTLPRFTGVVTLAEAQGIRFDKIDTRYREAGGEVVLRLDEETLLDQLRVLLDLWFVENGRTPR